jgi:selenocysteine-specific elongation factor
MAEYKIKTPEIVPVMIGTAGHVDHGKTALVRLLTGCETDILPEEKKRGMSIDLGFAPFLLDDNRMAGIIDVPGHEDFIRNMIAGASSIDVLILTIAADDGVMPQTIEHLKIMSLLQTPEVMAVITKIDITGKERQMEVSKQVQEFLKEYGFSGAPVILESNITGEGLGEVREAINKLVCRIKRPKETKPFRMNIERVFSVKGYGTVVTGIPLSGKCVIEQELELLPGAHSVICRSIQKYSMDSSDATAHACSAINLRAGKLPELERGMTLASTGVYRETVTAVLSIKNVHESLPLKRRQELRFCCGTSNRIVSGVLLGKNESLAPGEKGFIKIKLSEPVVLAAGDRFILRTLSPSATVAGGVVLSVNPPAGKKKAKVDTVKLEKALEAAEQGDYFLSEIIAGGSAVINQTELPFFVQGDKESIRIAIEEKVKAGVLVPAGKTQWIVKDRIVELEEKLRYLLAAYHKDNKISRGMPFPGVCSILGLEKENYPDLSKIFAGSGVLSVQSDCVSLKSFAVEMTAKQKYIREKIIGLLSKVENSAVALNTIEAELKVDMPELRVVIRFLTEEGLIYTLDKYVIFSKVVINALDKLKEHFKNESTVELNRFRELTGLSRNVAVTVLEYFDSKGITCREGKARRLANKSYLSKV